MDWKDDLVKLHFPRDPQDIKVEPAKLLKYEHMPERLYKYYRAKGHSIENLAKDQVWLCSPKNLNDPFDCSLTYSNELILTDLLRSRLVDTVVAIADTRFQLTLLDKENISGSADPVKELTRTLARQDPSIRPELYEVLADAASEALRKSVATTPLIIADAIKDSIVLSAFSERKDSILMWSHYASNHEGFCVEYDLKSLGPGSKTTSMLYPVIYRDQLLDVTQFLVPTDPKVRKNNTIGLYAALVKATEWAYEKEWRLIFPFGVLNEQAWSMPTPKAVYLGARISDNDKKTIQSIALSKGVPLLQTIPSKTTFSLEFKIL